MLKYIVQLLFKKVWNARWREIWAKLGAEGNG